MGFLVLFLLLEELLFQFFTAEYDVSFGLVMCDFITSIQVPSKGRNLVYSEILVMKRY
jgi:hypothetical protein